jgi:serine-type D-Ala-D-Ala carboxypeptidase (penicillin-binding protein 5/6)
MDKLFLLSTLFMLFLFSVSGTAAAEDGFPDLTSEGAVLMDSQSGAVLFGKNEEVKMYPASLTKIATAIYAIEKGNLDDLVTITEEVLTIDGTRVYLNPGEQVTFKKLIQGMMINSGNDAALAIAIHLDGNMENFSLNVNEYLDTNIGVKSTHFINPHGLFDENHYTTAKDLGVILNYAMNNEDFREIFGTKQMKWDGESWDTTIHSHHRMLKGEIPYQGVTGGKTGFVDQSKQTLATTADNGQVKLTAILLKSEYKRKIYEDTIKLFDYGFSHFKSSQLKKGEVFTKDKQKFIAEADAFLSEPVNGSQKSVTTEGVLKIQDASGDVVQQVELEEIDPEQPKVKKAASEPEKNGLFSNSVLGGFLFLLAVTAWILNKRLRRNRRFRSR